MERFPVVDRQKNEYSKYVRRVQAWLR